MAFTLIQHLACQFDTVINSHEPNKKYIIKGSNMKDVLDLTKAVQLYKFKGWREGRAEDTNDAWSQICLIF